MFTQAQLVEQIEELVDGSDLASVVMALALVCMEKAEHLECNWQDTARVWNRAGNKIIRLAEDNSVITLS